MARVIGRCPAASVRASVGVVIVTAALGVGTAPAGARAVPVSPRGSITVTMKGNGHGHGLSQYGAQGAARAGLSYRKIVGFYYPHTRLVKLPRSWIRVRLSDFGHTTRVTAYSHLHVTGVRGALPTRGVRQYRLIANRHRGLTLQRLRKPHGARWRVYRVGLPNGTGFHRSNYGAIRVFEPDGSSTRYRGSLRSFRKHRHGRAGGVYTVNRVTLDRYTAGVVPREMPASWRRQALAAQAIAARTYGRYNVRHPRGAHYDICDTTDCQVYGGRKRYSSHGHVLYSDQWRAAADTSNRILRHDGRIVFAQFSASDGGWTANGGQPYLTARKDPYDARGSGDPYLSYRRTVRTSALGSYFGIAKLSKITITRRDGHGYWGGRVEAVTLSGRGPHGRRKAVHTDGYGMQAALGLGTTWFSVSAS